MKNGAENCFWQTHAIRQLTVEKQIIEVQVVALQGGWGGGIDFSFIE